MQLDDPIIEYHFRFIIVTDRLIQSVIILCEFLHIMIKATIAASES